jgi:hypothetical protein
VTREEFLEGYADRSGTTVAWLLSKGQVAVRCACGADNCPGWALFDRSLLAKLWRDDVLPEGVDAEAAEEALADG